MKTITLFDPDRSVFSILELPRHASDPQIVRILSKAIALAHERGLGVSVSGIPGRLTLAALAELHESCAPIPPLPCNRSLIAA